MGDLANWQEVHDSVIVAHESLLNAMLKMNNSSAPTITQRLMTAIEAVSDARAEIEKE